MVKAIDVHIVLVFSNEQGSFSGFSNVCSMDDDIGSKSSTVFNLHDWSHYRHDHGYWNTYRQTITLKVRLKETQKDSRRLNEAQTDK